MLKPFGFPTSSSSNIILGLSQAWVKLEHALHDKAQLIYNPTNGKINLKFSLQSIKNI